MSMEVQVNSEVSLRISDDEQDEHGEETDSITELPRFPLSKRPRKKWAYYWNKRVFIRFLIIECIIRAVK